MIVKLSIDTSGDAFAASNPGAELARILRDAADRVDGRDSLAPGWFPLRDLNGNTVGRADLRVDWS